MARRWNHGHAGICCRIMTAFYAGSSRPLVPISENWANVSWRNNLATGFETVPDVRLIERWLPIAALGVESTRERTPMTPFPAPNRLHVWWARRPLVAARAAVLASLLPADADRGRFLHVIGIHGDPVAAKRRISAANRTGERLGAGAYGYPRAFGYIPDDDHRVWLRDNTVRNAVVLDPTAGGGSVPFESVRVGLHTIANDLTPSPP